MRRPSVAILVVCALVVAAAPRVRGVERQSVPRTASRYAAPVFASVDVKPDVVFSQVTGAAGQAKDLTLDVYQPSGDASTVRPAILWIHGGGFKPGTDKRQKYIVTMATEFAKRGYVSVAPDYRVRQDPKADAMGTLRDAVADCRAALAWIRANREAYRIDPGRIVVAGGSAGGKTAVSLVIVENADARAGQPRPIVALVDLWGSPEASLMLGEIDSRFPPTVIVHGTKDESVPFALSEAMAGKLKANGIDHVLMPIPDAPHTPIDHMAEILETTATFLARVLNREP
jgi:acetyl esterase/lipase